MKNLLLTGGYTTYDLGKYYVILQNNSLLNKTYNKKFNAKKVIEQFSYSSGSNKKFLNIKEIRYLIKKYVK